MHSDTIRVLYNVQRKGDFFFLSAARFILNFLPLRFLDKNHMKSLHRLFLSALYRYSSKENGFRN
jgi:hypothetical protein